MIGTRGYAHPHSGAKAFWGSGTALCLIASFLLTVFFLGGRVEIGLMIRGNELLRNKNAVLQQDLDRFAAEINRLKSYPRIKSMAQSIALQPLSPDQIETLEVDLDGIFEMKWKRDAFQYAGLFFFGAPARRPESGKGESGDQDPE